MIAAVFTLAYMAPWMVAAARGKSNHMAVFWLNLLLGWTVVAWIVAMVRAAAPHNAVLASRPADAWPSHPLVGLSKRLSYA